MKKEDVFLKRQFRYYDVILGLFVAVLLISNIVSTKIVSFWQFTFDGGTILFPLSYIFGDMLTEVYGFRKARKVIWTGFFCALLMSVIIIAVGKMTPATDWNNQLAYDTILGLTPRIVIASLIAYLFGEYCNSVILAKMKIWTGGRWLWTRTIGSTVIGELIDTSLFCLIAFYGVLPTGLLISVVASNYIFKVGVEVVFTPVTYAVVGIMKRKENIDYYDTDTSFKLM